MNYTTSKILSRRQALTHAGIVGLGIAALPSVASAFFWSSHDNSAYFAVDGIAIEGYDIISYFEDGRPKKGSANHQAKWEGSLWRFATAEHLEAFSENPTKYAPVYGGYCAYAAARNATSGIVPDAFTVYKDKLYLNNSLSIRESWRSNIDSEIRLADQYWPSIKASLG